jgi:A/G-specific adenine glycosylase
MRWYEACRRDLPWRRSRDPWAIWVSEIMLQQTRVDTVMPYFERFMARFPTPAALAEATEDEVLSAWSGLGYYRRARMLHAGARAVARSAGDGGKSAIPTDRDGLLELPGIGPYTAGAIASIAFGQAVGLVDGNVARVLARIFAIDDDMRRAGMRRAVRLAESLVDERDPGGWNQALMELGATVCTPRAPTCDRCPVRSSCIARAQERVHELPVIGPKAKAKAAPVQALVARKDGLVLLARRRSEGLFGGLWEPPMVSGGSRMKADLFGRFSLAGLRRCGQVVHVLSHRRLTVDVHAAVLTQGPPFTELPDAYEDAALFDEESRGKNGVAAIGLATFARKVLAAARRVSAVPKSK